MTTVPDDEQAIAILNEMFAGLSDRHRKIMSEVVKSSMAMARTYVAMEREACAKIAEEEGDCRHVDHAQGFCACQSKADAIRARGST